MKVANVFQQKKVTTFILLSLLLVMAFASSIIFGQTPISAEEAVRSFTSFDQNLTSHIVVRYDRLPRAVIGTVVGAGLAVSGTLMQAMTRNPMASPSIFGINNGAIFFIVVGMVFFSVSSLVSLMWLAFAGAALAALIVYILGSLGRDGLTPVKIVLAGAAISALFQSYTQGILVFDEAGLQDVLFWLAGSVSGRTLDMLIPVLPFIVTAMITALLMGRAINLLVTGDDIAKGMGQNILLIKAAMGAIVVVLAGSSVAIVGAVGFIGLVIPHIARFFAGTDYRWILPYSAILGAFLLVGADVAARLVIRPQEVPIGVMTAIIGGPFFIYIARRGLKSL
ncbi:FecCD family ABC transporter permease [Salipaludibacillus aurantiacus]|uniref:Iron complex transport system permease protein n=1 Tax=Salipaludibacillus aurantiacus TaxID=1601833 RepID=A0A1H9U9L8_9BACI|nr:iron ABC transporter permease [Salipaludibacillus aurantiacus]SES06146.1 iron complex transport system permease protein [Salipaludibacillus aurantiacus]